MSGIDCSKRGISKEDLEKEKYGYSSENPNCLGKRVFLGTDNGNKPTCKDILTVGETDTLVSDVNGNISVSLFQTTLSGLGFVPNFSFTFQVNDPVTTNNPLRIDITAPAPTEWHWGDATSNILPSIGASFNKIYASTGDYNVDANVGVPSTVTTLLIRGNSTGTVINTLDLSIFTGLSLLSLDDLEGVSNLILPVMNVTFQFSLVVSQGIGAVDDFSKLNINFNNSDLFFTGSFIGNVGLVNQAYTQLDSVTTAGFTGRRIFMNGGNPTPTGAGIVARDNLISKGVSIFT